MVGTQEIGILTSLMLLKEKAVLESPTTLKLKIRLQQLKKETCQYQLKPMSISLKFTAVRQKTIWKRFTKRRKSKILARRCLKYILQMT